MKLSKPKMAAGNNKKGAYSLLLILAMAMAIMCTVMLHKLRESRSLSLLLQERDNQLLSLHFFLQKERESSKEMKKTIDYWQAKIVSTRNQKMELSNKLAEAQYATARFKNKRVELEAALEEKQTQIDKLTDKAEEFMKKKLQFANLTSLLKQKEAEVEEMKINNAKQALVQSKTYEKLHHQCFGAGDENKEDGLPQKGEWVKFQTNMDEVDSKAENVSRANQQEGVASEGKEMLKYNSKNLNGVKEDGKDDTNSTEETVLTSKEKDSHSIQSEYHSNVEEANQQPRTPQVQEVVGKPEFKERSGRRRRRTRVRRKKVPRADDGETVSANIEHGLAKDDEMIRYSSEKTETAEVMTNSSTYDRSTSNTDSFKKEMGGNEQVKEIKGDESREAKNEELEEVQRDKNDEGRKDDEENRASNDLQLPETNNSEVKQISHDNGEGFTDATQKKAGEEVKLVGSQKLQKIM